MRRREFLVGSAASAGLLLAGRAAHGRTWGEPPATAASLVLPEGQRAERVLEVFLYGGLSPWESFYTVPEYGRPNDPQYPNQQWHLFAGQHSAVFGACGVPSGQWMAPFATDAAGATVQLGPLTLPLRNRPDVLARTRVVVMRHDLEPHEAAIPYALAGMRLGSPRLVGMGAHVQRAWLERSPRSEPYAYVLQPENIFSTDNTRAAEAVGLHPGSARPLGLKVAPSQAFLEWLDRAGLGSRRQAWDALVAHYGQQARAHYAAGGTPLRASALDDHASASEALARADAIRSVLGDGFMAVRSGQACGDTTSLAYTRMGLEAAAHLLTHPTAPARYVNVVDTGLDLADGGGGYDTHFDHMYPQARNTTFMLRELMALINEPGEGDPDKIDLDETMVVLTTEFGRTPTRQFGGEGTNHHPYGYVNVLIGGPIGPEQSGVVGAIGPDGVATDWVTPSELRAALLAATGLYPFAHESFAVGDVRDVPTEADALVWLRSHVLGVPA